MNKRETVEIVSSRQPGTWKEIQWRTCRDMVLVPDANVKRGRRLHDTTGDKRGDSRYGRLHQARKYNRDVPLERESFVSASGAAAEKRSRYSTGEYLCAVLRRHNAHHCIVRCVGPSLDISEN
ncbi:hypothetical protein ALC62_10071 [Cyphomyrmex costatus]|uniref:Uncharacterized protein n=1 Tax=Cyphomyrmex costatus TaxID=456900 RepID=A0A151IEG8_9HYME|nr:hypothetical protein ALC62_10071 [Cyphomyrmex costatus]